MKYMEIEELAVEFLLRGHYYCPDCSEVGEVTKVAIGPDLFLAKCSTDRFLKEVAASRCKSVSLIRKQSMRWLQHRKHVPLELTSDFVLLQFSFGTSFSKAHRKAGIRLTSIQDYKQHLLDNACTLLLSDSHILEIPCSKDTLRRQLTWGEHVALYSRHHFNLSKNSNSYLSFH